jgi:NagD protein
MTELPAWSYLMDLDGALMHDEEHVVSGADSFLAALHQQEIPFMVLTNKSAHTPQDLRARLLQVGLDVAESAIWTSALATAQFLDLQRSRGAAYVVGEAGLTTALHNIGYVLTDHEPDYVILGETRTYSFSAITKAIRLIERGAKFIATNPDEKGTSHEGSLPTTGAVAALIERVTGRTPYSVGKPNPLMIRSALRALGAHSANTLVIGDRMDTDVRSGLESGLRTILVLSGISSEETAEMFPYRPTKVITSVAELTDRVADPFGHDQRRLGKD